MYHKAQVVRFLDCLDTVTCRASASKRLVKTIDSTKKKALVVFYIDHRFSNLVVNTDKTRTLNPKIKKNSTTTLGSSSQGGPSHSAVLTLTSLPE